MKVGLIGLGHMGLPMAGRLAAAGFPLTAMAGSAVASPFIGYKRAAFLHPDTAPVSFAAALMRKDLALALSVAAPAGLPLPVASAARDYLDTACAAGYSDADFACVAELLRRRAASPLSDQTIGAAPATPIV
jgi:3-hydroxyisobutyrate dehydrogenase-like beta-hydroxyacid dehydrogenase